MSITMGYLYEKSIHLYKMKILAGEEGLNRQVEWIHMIESAESASFLHGSEIIFLTGVLYQGANWLLDFVKRLYKSKCSGFIVNVGPYIKKVPQIVIEYCDEHKLPLFILPWSVHLVDVTRYLCQFIIDEKKREQNILSYLQQLLLLPDEYQSPCISLEYQGVNVEGNFRIITISTKCTQHNYDEVIALLKLWNSELLALYIHGKIVIIVVEKNLDEIQVYCKEILHFLKKNGINIFISVGSQISHIKNIYYSYKQAESINKLAQNKALPIVFYDYMGVYKLLLNGTSVNTLISFYKDTLGALEEYDEAHQSNLMETLRYYIEHNCSIKETASYEVVHRNTILYKFNKIEKILGKSVYSEENKLEIFMAFKIKNLI